MIVMDKFLPINFRALSLLLEGPTLPVLVEISHTVNNSIGSLFLCCILHLLPWLRIK